MLFILVYLIFGHTLIFRKHSFRTAFIDKILLSTRYKDCLESSYYPAQSRNRQNVAWLVQTFASVYHFKSFD